MRANTPSTPSEFIAAAQQAHQAGRLADAEAAYRQALDVDPRHPDALHLLGIVHFQTGRTDAAFDLVNAAIAAQPAIAAYRYTLGLGYQQLGRLPEALAAYREALRIDPSHYESHVNCAAVFESMKDPGSAIESMRRALALRPGDVRGSLFLAHLLETAMRHDEALEVLETAHAANPPNGRILTGIAAQHLTAQQFDRALAAAQEAVAADPNDPDCFGTLGTCLQAVGELEDAAAAFAESHRLRRSVAFPDEIVVCKSKLRHDAEQFDYLAGLGRGAEFAAHADTIRGVLDEMPAEIPDTRRVRISAAQTARLAPIFTRPLHIADAPLLTAGAINPELDADAITAAYRANEPGICHVDGLLRPEALESLRKYCLETTMWHDFYHSEGYIGAMRDDGFAAPLLLQIAEELREALPGIFRDFPVRQLWAFKYDSEIAGITTHADSAAVNVNFWITPDDANLAPDAGGLVVHKAECPLDWAFTDYNSTDLADINAFVEENSKGTVVVPHRQNRAVIFNSDLFHATDTIRFRPGYENRRINVTLLYGDRHLDTVS